MNIYFSWGVPTAPADHPKSKPQEMRLASKSENISIWSQLFAVCFTWILLAGFLVLPGSFSKLEGIEIKSGDLRKVVQAIRHLPLYVLFFSIYPPSSNCLEFN